MLRGRPDDGRGGLGLDEAAEPFVVKDLLDGVHLLVGDEDAPVVLLLLPLQLPLLILDLISSASCESRRRTG